MDPRWRNRLFNGLLLCFSIVAALIVGEALVRLKMEAWPFDYEAVSLPYMTEEDSILRWRTPPGAGRNSLGLRDQEITDKDADTFRILILGRFFGLPR